MGAVHISQVCHFQITNSYYCVIIDVHGIMLRIFFSGIMESK